MAFTEDHGPSGREAHISTKFGLFYKEEGLNECRTCGQQCSLCHDGYPGQHLPHTSAEMLAVLALDVQRERGGQNVSWELGHMLSVPCDHYLWATAVLQEAQSTFAVVLVGRGSG